MAIPEGKDAPTQHDLPLEQFALALRELGFVTWLWAPDSNQTRWFGDAARLLGRADDRFDGSFEDYLRSLHPEDRVQARTVFVACLKGQRREYRIEERVVCADGTIRWLETYGRGEYGASGRCVRMMGVVHDATDRVLAEQRLRDSQAKLRELNRSLEQRVRGRTVELQAAMHELESFSYSVSHDLRAPLRAVAGFTELLRERHGGELSAEGLRLVALVEENTARMGMLISSLLQLSQAGRRELKREPLDMAELASDVARGVFAQTGRPVELALGAVPAAHGDRVLLRQVWTNLIDNAVKYTRKVAAPRVEIGGVRNGAWLEYYVKDNGAGFDPAQGARLFAVFRRLHPETEFEGTGVGLALVARIVRRHGGEVSAEGSPGAGATFRFTLPA